MSTDPSTDPSTAPDLAELRAAIEDADLRVLLMCLVHLTGDQRWMRSPYLPKRDVRLIADPLAGFSDEIVTEIRTAIEELLAPGIPTPVLDDPGAVLMAEMIDACLGEKMPAEYLPMIREDMGFETADTQWSANLRSAPAVSVLVVGAGIFGLSMAVQLKRLGIAFTVVEKNTEVGGTWFENRYPGCGVDTPNHFYSYSYAPNHGWKHYFSPRDELFAYVDGFATDQDLRRHIQFDTELVAATWDDDAQQWEATLRRSDGGSTVDETVRANVLVTAIGHFNKPNPPTIPGVEDFAGPIFHSARWPSDLDLKGKDVAIVGTGASSMQIVPTIAGEVGALTIYQRSPQWARNLPELSAEVKPGTQWLLEHVPYYAQWNRFTLFWRYGDGLLRHLRKDPDWPHPERSLNRVNDRHRVEMTDHITTVLASRPDLIPKCLPTYPPYGKRILLDKGWFAALLQPNVELVTDAIDRIESNGIVTADGTSRHADVVVLATGFSVTDLAARLNITGRGGRRLADEWADDNPRAYLGMTVPGFPNFFCMYGPNTNLGHGGSGIFVAECQTRYITGAVVEMVERDIGALEVKPAVWEEFIDRVDAEHEHMIWTHPGMSTYYRNRSGRVVSTLPFRLVDLWQWTRRPELGDFAQTPAPTPTTAATSASSVGSSAAAS